MSQAARWSIRLAQADAGDASDAANPVEDAGRDLPANFATRLGTLAILNYVEQTLTTQANDYGLPQDQFSPMLATTLDQFAAQNKLTDADFLAAVSASIGTPKAVRAQEATFAAIFQNLADEYNQTQVSQQQPIAMQYCPEPTDGTFNGGKGTGQQLWKQLGSKFQTMFNNMVDKIKASMPLEVQPYAAQATNTSRIVSAQSINPQQGPLSTGRYESLSQLRDELIAMGPTPETYERFMAMVGPDQEDDAKDALASFFQGLGASLGQLYDMLVGKELANPIDAEIVEKLMSQHPELAENGDKRGEPAANIQANADCSTCKAAGLFLPPVDSGINTKSEHLNKTAATSAYPAYESHGPGENRMCPKIRQPVSTYICRYHCLDGLPVDDHQIICAEAIWRQAVMDKFSREYRDKDGNWVGGYINKRFEVHYDDGGHPALLKPGQRHAPIHEDAWSLEKRMQEMRRTEGATRGYSETPGDPKGLYNFDQHDLAKGPKNPQLSEKKKDPIARLAESDTQLEKTAQVDQPDDFLTHQHSDEMIPPDAPAAPREKAKTEYENAFFAQGEEAAPYVDKIESFGAAAVLKELSGHYTQGTHQSFGNPPWGSSDNKFSENIGSKKYVLSWNNHIPYVSLTVVDDGFGEDAPWATGKTAAKKEEKKEIEKADKDWNPNPWAVCHTTVDKKKDPEKFEKCVMDVKKKQAGFNLSSKKEAKQDKALSDSWTLTKEAWGMDPMMDNVDHGPRGKKCATCGKIMSSSMKQCDNPKCRGMNLVDYNEKDVQQATHFIKAPDIKIKAEADGVEVKFALGVYKASKNGVSAFGDTAEESIEKLAKGPDGLAKTKPMDIATEGERLMGFRREEKEFPNAAPNPSVAGQNVAEPVPTQDRPAVPPVGAQPVGKIVMDEAAPLDQTSPVPVESQGPSEFFPPEVVGPEGWKAPGEEPGPDEGHVSADMLDQEIATTQAGMHPDEHKAIVEQAINSGAHPRQKE